jgi:cation/acetate symporter
MYWRRLTTRGATIGGFAGLAAAILCMLLGPTIWVEVLDNETAIFPYKHPALFSMLVSFAVTWMVSRLDRSSEAKAEAAKFDAQYVRSQTGLGAETARSH